MHNGRRFRRRTVQEFKILPFETVTFDPPGSYNGLRADVRQST
jgi:hypothetical protein